MFPISTILTALFFLQVKHLIIDWIWQPEFEHKNKGIFMHPGGLLHASKNAFGTTFVLITFFGITALPLFFLDFIIHYTIDLCKVKINSHYGLDPKRHPEFWWLTGIDQFLHQITYIWLIYLLVYHI